MDDQLTSGCLPLHGRSPEEVATRTINHQRVQRVLDLRQFARHALPQHAVIAQGLGLDALDELLGLASKPARQ